MYSFTELCPFVNCDQPLTSTLLFESVTLKLSEILSQNLAQTKELSDYVHRITTWGWSGGAKVLGKLPVPGRPTDLDYSTARAYCACSRCGWGLFGHFSLIYHFSFLSPSLWETA